MKIRLTKTALVGYLVIFGTGGTIYLLRSLGLHEVAEILDANINVLQTLDTEKIAVLIFSLLSIHQGLPLFSTEDETKE